MIHGVGKETHPLYIDKGAHERLVARLATNQTDLWTAPFIEVAKYVKGFQEG
jgi:hypothetical protein